MADAIKAELIDLGPHNGMCEPDNEGSYHAFTLAEKGQQGDEPQKLTFIVPSHQLPCRTDLARPMPDVDTLANIIRIVDGNHDLGAGELAERILSALEGGE